ncbi:MAG TPA: hypothetical protein VMF91_12190 [Bryobacteraceae bacterium]|nr:hypothetical protein [Bryobacteraceae bacterium]
MKSELDTVATYARSMGWDIRARTVLVEGTTDVALFELAARTERKDAGVDLFANGLAIIAAGEGDQGGTRGVIRELNALRCLARASLMPNGRPRYRFVGLFDNDHAGRQAISGARVVDTSILEYKDVFRLRPVMPCSGNLDPKTLEKAFDHVNAEFVGLDWALEDLLPVEFLDAFRADFPTAIRRRCQKSGKTHWEFTPDGKARLHRYIRNHSMRADLLAVIDVVRALRFYLGLPRIT